MERCPTLSTSRGKQESGKVCTARRLWILVSCAILPASGLFLFGPANIYLGNADEFQFGLLDILLLYLSPFLIAVGALTAAGFVFGRRGWVRYASFVFGLGLLLWVQGNFWVCDCGILDARGIEWEPLDRFAGPDLGLWAVVLALAFVGARWIFKAFVPMCWALVAVQAGALLWQGGRLEGDFLIKQPPEPEQLPAEILQYSNQKNILHVILDSLQTDVFRELVREEGWDREFEGFVLFQENAGVAPDTSFAIPAIFSGRVYDGSTSAQEYFGTALKHGLTDRLCQEGYTVNIVPEIAMREGRYSHAYQIPENYKGSRADLLARDAAMLFDVALFRQAPHRLKRYVYNENNWLVTARIVEPYSIRSIQQKAFFKDYIEALTVGGERPAYHFLHLWPPHPPYVVNRHGGYAGSVLPNTRENYRNECRAVLKLFRDLLDKLRRLGIYEETLIVLQGDHGSQIPPEIDGRRLDFMPTRLAALLAVKRRQARGPMRVSHAQTCVADIAKTILDAEGLESDLPGESVFRLDPEQNRDREFIVYRRAEHGMPILKRYSIRGSIFDPASYTEKEPLRVNVRPRTYQFGETVKLGLNGNGSGFLGEGWAEPMDWYNWSRARLCTLNLRFPRPRADLEFSVKILPHVDPKVLPRQRIGVTANGERVADWTADIAEITQFSATISQSLARSGRLRIQFELPDAASPRDLGLGADVRELAIALYEFRLDLKESAKAD